MGKWLFIGGIVLTTVFILAVGFFVLVYPQMVTTTPSSPPNLTPAPTSTSPSPYPTPTPLPSNLPNSEVNQIKLIISSPEDKAVVKSPVLTVTGETVPNADVTINELDLKTNAAGKFSGKLTLSEGQNPIIITAVDANGNYTEREIVVTYEPAQ